MHRIALMVGWLALAGTLITTVCSTATSTNLAATPPGGGSKSTNTSTTSSLYRLHLLLPNTSSSTQPQAAFLEPYNNATTPLPGDELVSGRILGGGGGGEGGRVFLSIDSGGGGGGGRVFLNIDSGGGEGGDVSDHYKDSKNISHAHPFLKPQQTPSSSVDAKEDSKNVLDENSGGGPNNQPSMLPKTRQITLNNNNNNNSPVGGSDTRAAVSMVESFVSDMVKRPSDERPEYVMINSRNPIIIQQLVEGLTRRYGSTSVIHDQNVIQGIISNNNNNQQQQNSEVIHETSMPLTASDYNMPVFPHKPHWQAMDVTETSEMDYIIRQLASLGHVTISTGTLINNTLSAESQGAKNTTSPGTTDDNNVVVGDKVNFVGDVSKTGNNTNNNTNSYVNESNNIDAAIIINPDNPTKKFNVSRNDGGESSTLNHLEVISSHPTDLPAPLTTTTSVDAHDATPSLQQPPHHHHAIQHSQGTHQNLEHDVSGTWESGTGDKNQLQQDLLGTIILSSWKNTSQDTNKYENGLNTSTHNNNNNNNNNNTRVSSGVYIDNVFHRTGSLSNNLYNTNKTESQIVKTNQSKPDLGYTSNLPNIVTNWSTPSLLYHTKHLTTTNTSSQTNEMKTGAIHASDNSTVSKIFSISTPSYTVRVGDGGVSSSSSTDNGLNTLVGVSVAPEKGTGVSGEEAGVTVEETKMAGTYNEDYYEEIDGEMVLSPTKFMRRTGPGDFDDDYYYQEEDESKSAGEHVVGREPEKSSPAQAEKQMTKYYESRPPGEVAEYGHVEEHIRENRPIKVHVVKDGQVGGHTAEGTVIIPAQNSRPMRVKVDGTQAAGISVLHHTTSDNEIRTQDGEVRRDGQIGEGERWTEIESVGGSEGWTKEIEENLEKTEKGHITHRQPHDPAYYRQSGPSFLSTPQSFFPTRPATQPTRPPQPRPQLTLEQQAIISRLPVGTQHVVSTIVQAMQATTVPPATPTLGPPAAPVPFPAPYYPAFPHYAFYPPLSYQYTGDPHTTHSQGTHNHGIQNHGAHNHDTHGSVGHDHSTHNHNVISHGLHSTQSISKVTTDNTTTQVASTTPPQTEVATLDPGAGPSRLGVAASPGIVEQVGVNRQGTPAQSGVQPDRNQGILDLRQDLHQMGHGRPVPPRVTQYRPPQQAPMHMDAPVLNVVVPQVASAPAPPQQEEGSLIDLLDTGGNEEEEASPSNDNTDSMDREEVNSLLQSLFSSPTLLLLGIVFATSAAYMAITMEEQAAQQRFQQAQLAAAFGGLPFSQPGRRRRDTISHWYYSSVVPHHEIIINHRLQ
ncbi:hypothetical protein Pmani_025847 [Petrolisthes manimaculis]|uniref:Uncharacterized protein n=1 Tax=Petrolisthes manimaculis TaxID=1843537 RepID=A0AAE1TX91_9EUCA|nr:hypothetical protein Pmani_025847 [Petrolisthes manimaculis]